jgi:hypothetical protein
MPANAWGPRAPMAALTNAANVALPAMQPLHAPPLPEVPAGQVC